MAECSNIIEYEKCTECGEIVIKRANLCRDRLCPVCSWRLAAKRFSEMMMVYDNIGDILATHTVSLMTLTVKNVKLSDLSETMNDMARSWKRMQERKWMSDNLVGWARSIEVTYNQDANTAHPHYHVLAIWRGKVQSDEYEYMIRQIWAQSSRINYVPQIDCRNAYTTDNNKDITSAAVEAMKYTAKTKDMIDMPMREFREFVRAIKGRRLISYGGAISSTRKALGFNDDVPKDEIDDTTIKCTKCNAPFAAQTAIWSGVTKRYILYSQSADIAFKEHEIIEGIREALGDLIAETRQNTIDSLECDK